jgi:DNA-binding response OmpR family regulator
MPVVNQPTNTIDRLAPAVAHLLQAIILMEEAVPGAFEDLGPRIVAALSQRPVPQNPPAAPAGNGSVRPLIADRETFCAHWANRACHLGNTMAFKLLERLARRPNQYVPCDVLLRELWDCHTSRDAVRSAVKVLRQKLNAAGMGDLAEAIDGSTAHHYGLMLKGRS